jgi:hypothetical protein
MDEERKRTLGILTAILAARKLAQLESTKPSPARESAIANALILAEQITRKQRLSEDWEYRRYQATLIHHSTAGLMDAYFSGKSEMLYLTSTLETLLITLNQLAEQADQIVRQQGGPALTVAELEQRKAQLLQPFQNFNQQQVTLRWNQYEQKAKENHGKAENHLTTLQRLIPAQLYDELVAMFARLSAPFVWDLPHGKEKLKTLEEALPEVLVLREKLAKALEAKLGRRG